MAQIVKLRRSSVIGKKPTNAQLELGELSINTSDGKLFFAKSGSLGPSVEEIVTTNTINTGSVNISGSLNIIGPITGSNVLTNHLEFETTADPSSNNGNAFVFYSGSLNDSDLYFSEFSGSLDGTIKLNYLKNNLYTGLLHGGTINAVAGATTYDISAGEGVVVELNASIDKVPYPVVYNVKWDNITGITPTNLTTEIQTFVGIDKNGDVVEQGTAFNNGQYNTVITLGTVLHANLSTINATISYPNVAYGYKQRTYDFIKAFGGLKLSGFDILPSGSLGVTVASGTAWADGRNYQNDPNDPSYIIDTGTTVSKIYRYYQVSGTTFVRDTNNGLGYTDLDPTQYVNNGVLTTIQNKYWSIQRIFWYPNSASKSIVVYYGNTQFESSVSAIANIPYERFVEEENTKQNAIYLGALVLREDATFLDPLTYAIIPGGIFRNVGGTGGGGAVPSTTLNDLIDVTTDNSQNGDLLVYNSTLNDWKNSKSLNGNYQITGSLLVSGSQTINGNLTLSTLTSGATDTDRFLISDSGVIKYRTGDQVLSDIGAIGGTIASGQVAFGTGVNTIGGDSGLTWDNVNKRLALGGVTPAQSIDTTGNIRVGGTYIYGDTNTPYLRLSDAVGSILGYGNLQLINGGSIVLLSSGIERFRITSGGLVNIGGSGNPTNTLDVNGTARIRTINNLGYTATEFLTQDPLGVIHKRTASETLADIGAIGGTIASGQVVFGTGTNTVGGSNNLFWDSANGRLGIGTNSPTQVLEVRGVVSIDRRSNGFVTGLNINSGSTPLSVFQINTDNANSLSIIGARNGFALALSTGDVERARITSSGLLGIATTSPTNTLDVNGTARIRTINNLGYTATEFLTQDPLGVIHKRTASETLADIGGIGGSGTTNYIAKFTASGTIGDSAVFESGGNVGIGTTSPAARLHTNNTLNSATAVALLEQNQSNIVNANALVQIKGVAGLSGASGKIELTDGTYTGYIQGGRDTNTINSYLAFGTTTNERMRITSTGNVLIGTTTDSGQKLQVNGNAYVSGNVGIGTTTPDNKFHVFSGVAGEVAQFTGAVENRGLSIRSETNIDASALVVFNSQSGGAAGTFSFETDGTERWRITSNGLLQSNGAQTIRTSTGNLTLATAGGNGNIVLSPNGTGNVGIGIAAPSSFSTRVVHIHNPSASGSSLKVTDGGSGFSTTDGFEFAMSNGVAYIIQRENNYLSIQTGASERMRITSSGNVLIGTTTDNGARLQVSGGGFISSELGVGVVLSSKRVSYGLEVRAESASAQIFFGRDLDNAGSGAIGANGTNCFIVYNGSSFGAPPLQIAQTGAATFSRSVTAANTGFGETGGFIINYRDNAASRSWRLGNDLDAFGDFGIQQSTTQTGSTYSNRLYITSSGNVGIGTTSPASKLQIEGTGTGAWLTINRTDSGTNIIDYTQSGIRLGYIGYIGSDLYLNNATASATAFFTNSTERLRITSSGNVLIGTTTDNGARLQVNGTGYFSGNVGIGVSPSDLDDIFTGINIGYDGNSIISRKSASQINISTNWTFKNGANSYVNNGLATRYALDSGFHFWFTSPSGTAGNAFSFVEVMRTTPSGNLLIGTTTDNGARLQVSGAVYASDELYLDNGKYLRFRRSSGNLSIQTLGIPSGTDDVRLLTTGDFNVLNGSLTNLMTVKNGGNVGIGTASPIEKLTIADVGINALGVYRDADVNVVGTAGQLIYIGARNGTTFTAGAAIVGVLDNPATTGSLDLQTRTSNSLTTKLRVSSLGNVLIGTTTDSGQKLQVSGNAYVSGNVGIATTSPTNTLDVNGTARIRTLSNATGDFVTASATGVLQKRTASETLADIGGIGGSGTTNYIPKFTASGTIGNSAVYDNGTNVGVNTTSFIDQKLRVNGIASFVLGNSNTSDLRIEGYNNRGLSVGNSNFGGLFGYQSNNITVNAPAYGTAIHMNARYDGTNYISQNSFIRPQLLLLRDGDFRFYRSNPVTANTNITLTEIVSITNEGTLGIGVSEPTNTLDVNGTARIRTISNATGDFVTASATGVLQKRTASETLADIGGIGGSGTTNYIPKFTASGTIGNSAVFESGGNVGIGTTNPVSHSGYTILTLGGSAMGLLKLRSTYNSGNGFELYQNTSGDVFFNINSTDAALVIKPNGNTLIGTTTDAGYKLDVNGTARIQANATNQLIVSTDGVYNTGKGNSTFFGYQAGFSDDGTNNGNTFIGYQAGYGIASNINNVCIGFGAGMFSGVSSIAEFCENSVYIGAGSRPNNISSNNEIVIGYNAIGLGDYSVVIGDNNINKTALKGNVLIGSTTDNGSKLQVNGNVTITNALISNQENLDVDSAAPEVIAQISSTTYSAAFFDYVIKNGTNLRAGTVYAVHDGTNVEFTETSTNDLGTTSGVTLSVDLSGGNIRLLATVTTDNWVIKSLVRGL